MRWSEAHRGRVFVIRLEHGDIVHESIERFAREQGIAVARVSILGGADCGSKLVVGPRRGEAVPPEPMETSLEEVHEMTGVGTLAPSESGQPVLHMHIACGRERSTVTGCVRAGVRVWHVAELVVEELTGSSAVRKKNATTGFALLEP